MVFVAISHCIRLDITDESSDGSTLGSYANGKQGAFCLIIYYQFRIQKIVVGIFMQRGLPIDFYPYIYSEVKGSFFY